MQQTLPVLPTASLALTPPATPASKASIYSPTNVFDAPMDAKLAPIEPTAQLASQATS